MSIIIGGTIAIDNVATPTSKAEPPRRFSAFEVGVETLSMAIVPPMMIDIIDK